MAPPDPMNRRARVLCLGHAAHDLIYRVPSIPTQPVKVVATSFSECGGGMAANAAVAVARLGGDVEYWGRVADDTLGRRILDDLEVEGVDVRSARRVSGCKSPCTSILVADSGERLVCSFADPALDPDPGWLPLQRVASFDVILADVRWPRGSARLLDAARAVGRPALLDADVAPPAILADLAGRASHVLFSEAGLAVISDGQAPGAALRRAHSEANHVVGVTLGAEGFLWIEGGVEHYLRAPTIVPVDTLAAGDIWHGAFALALAEGKPSDQAATFANAAAALKCQRPGGRSGAPSRLEVEAVLASEGQ
jgi:sulfofructose kinase